MKAEDLDKDEAEFLRVCETRVRDGEGKLKVSGCSREKYDLKTTCITW